uniref:FYVE-type domain-containing protein n=1 Tax=Phytophthora ramorum TaxID=164328 RepID=H3HE81_PHYRM
MQSRNTDTPLLHRTTSVDTPSGGGGASKLRRMRFRSKTRSATATSLSIPSTSSGSAHKPRVQVDDDVLCARAEAVARAMDFRGLAGSTEAGCRWVLKKSRGSFTTYARQPEVAVKRTPLLSRRPEDTSSKVHQVLAAGEIRCHLQEVVHVLQTTKDFDHNAVMSGLYRKDFIYGSVVHVVPADVVGDEPRLVELLEEEESTTTQVAVKTGTFVHSKMFSPNEQWCFLERAQHVRLNSKDSSDQDDAFALARLNSFTLTLSSLDEKELEAGKVNDHGRVNMLRDMSTGYLVVRRRRFGAQTMADRAAFPAKNSHCICCTRSLHLLTRKHRCHLCGHFVCDRCWSVQETETQTARRVTTVRVCTRCIEFVDNGDYSAVRPGSLGNVEVKRDPTDRPPTNKTLARLLQKELRSASGSRKNSVRTVIQYLVNQEAEEERAKAERQAKPDSEARADQEYLDALDADLSIHQVPLYQYVDAEEDANAPSEAERGVVSLGVFTERDLSDGSVSEEDQYEGS